MWRNKKCSNEAKWPVPEPADEWPRQQSARLEAWRMALPRNAALEAMGAAFREQLLQQPGQTGQGRDVALAREPTPDAEQLAIMPLHDERRARQVLHRSSAEGLVFDRLRAPTR